MKVAVIAGSGKSLLNFRGPLLAEMVRLGHRVVACASGYDRNVVDALSAKGVSYRPLKMERTGLNPFLDLQTCFILRKLLKDIAPDMVFASMAKPVIYGSFAAAYQGGPKMFSMIEGLGYAFTGQSSKRKLLSHVLTFLYRKSLARNEHVFFLNPDDKVLFETLKIIDRSKNITILNGIGVDLTHYKFQSFPPLSPVTFLLIARLLSDKGIYEYVQAAQKLKEKYPDTEFHLVGPFDSNPAAIKPKTVDRWIASGAIQYHGETNDVKPFLTSCCVYVLPSFYREGMPRTILEAMSTGRPIITTDTPGCRETVIHGENGFLVPVKDVRSLIAAMERFIMDPEIISTFGQRSREMAIERFDVKKVNNQLMEIMGLS